VPSWNNNHYCYLTGAIPVEVPAGRETSFFPDPVTLAPHLKNARLLVINSPLNPTGTVVDPETLSAIAQQVVDENHRRTSTGERPLYLLYDQVYWTLTFGDAKHYTPVELVPEVAPYTILLDAVSKSFCGTGLRVGWAVMAPAIRSRMADIIGHVGAWAPKAEQMATARLLDSPGQVSAFHSTVIKKLQMRLDLLHDGFERMRLAGLPVEAIPPQGAIYLTVRFNFFGGMMHDTPITTNEQIRKILLDEAGIGIVPFQAFGLRENTGWFRFSVGAVSVEDIESALPRVEKVLESLRPERIASA
jgi:aspartate aminotransferase